MISKIPFLGLEFSFNYRQQANVINTLNSRKLILQRLMRSNMHLVIIVLLAGGIVGSVRHSPPRLTANTKALSNP
jgi:hypothetical protein